MSSDNRNENGNEIEAEETSIPCCSSTVHIAFRGKADDRLYMVYERNWQELRYYQQNGLRVFCAACRRRVF